MQLCHARRRSVNTSHALRAGDAVMPGVVGIGLHAGRQAARVAAYRRLLSHVSLVNE